MLIQMKRKKTRRLLSFVMSVVIAVSYVPSAVFAASATAEASSAAAAAAPDVTGHWAARQVTDWTSKGLVNSYPDGSFKPEQGITRAEFTKLINGLFGFTAKGENGFSDVGANAWYADTVAVGEQAGFINGYPDGTFKPNAAITRQEAAKIAAGLFRLPAVTGADPLEAFADKAQIGAFAVEPLGQLVGGGYLKGFPNGTVQPLKSITRAEAVVLLSRLAGEVYAAAGTYRDRKQAGNALVNRDGVTIESSKIDGNLFLTAGIGEGDFTLNHSEVKGTIYVSGGGIHSVHLNNVQAPNIVVDKKEGPVRVVIDGSDIDTMELDSDTVLETNNSDIDRFNNNTDGSTLNGKKLDKGKGQVGENSGAGGETAPTPTPTPTPDQWDLIWSDEFDGTGDNVDTNGVNLDKWGYQEGDGTEYGVPSWGNNEQQYYRKENISVDPNTGHLVITAKKEAYKGKPYTSGRLWTSGTFTKAYGKFEARMKLPDGEGIWPAFWMMPADSEYGGWAASGEIDIMEARGRLPEEVGGTIHYGKNAPNNKSTGAAYYFPEGEDITGYHTYSVEWEPGELRWYVDGKLYQKLTNWNSWGADQPDKYAYPAPFDKPFYIILNLAVGGVFDNNRLPADSDVPAQMEVDYVRAYELASRPYKTPIEPTNVKDAVPANAKAIVDQDFEHGLTDISTSAVPLHDSYWNFLHTPDFGGAGTATIDTINNDRFAKVSITNGGNVPYALQMIQYATLTKGYNYKISFDAKASAARNISVKFGGDADNGWGAYSDNFDAALTTNMKHYEYRFQMTNETDLAARLEFNLGTNANTVWLGNIVVEEVDKVSEPNGAKDPLGNGEHVYNGSFDLGTMDRMVYWNFHVNPAASASASVDSSLRQLEVAITDGGENPAAIMLTQKGLHLLQNDSYELTFDASTDTEHERTIEAVFLSKDGQTIYSSQSFTINDTLATQELFFTMPIGVTDAEGQLVFKLGGDDADLVIDNVSLIRTTYNNYDFTGVDMFPLKNGDFFAGMKNWETNSQEGGAAQFSVQDGAAQINVASVGNVAYSNMLIQGGLSLKKGLNYTLEFDAKSSVARELQATLENASYQRILDTGAQQIGADWTHYKFTFRSKADQTLALKFMMGKTPSSAVGTIWIDNVVLEVQNGPVKRPPELLADLVDNKAGIDIVIPFSDNAAWRNAIASVEVDGRQLNASQYEVGAGNLTIRSDIFTEEGNYQIKIIAAGYGDTAIIQPILAIDGNLIMNGSFKNDSADWEFWQGGGASAYSTYSVVEGKAKLQIYYNGGTDNQWGVPYDWSTQLVQSGIQLKAGKTYELSFKAWSDVNRPIMVELNGYNNNQKVAFYITGDEDNVYTKVLKPTTDVTIKVVYLLGNVISGNRVTPSGEHTVYIDNVVLFEKPAAPILSDDDSGNLAGNPIELTFNDNTVWREAITAIQIDHTVIDEDQYTVTAGKITLHASLFPAKGSYAISVYAAGFAASEVIQDVIPSDGNLIENGSFTDGAASWDYWKGDGGDSAFAVTDGNAKVDIYYNGGIHPQWNVPVSWSTQLFQPSIKLQAGKSYELSFRAWSSVDRPIQIELTGYNGDQKVAFNITEAAEQLYSKVITPAADVTLTVKFLLGNVIDGDETTPEGVHTVTIDDVAIREKVSPPALTADSTDNKLTNPIELTFADSAAWRSAITGLTVDGAAVDTSKYIVAAGTITLDASLFPSIKTYSIAILANGYAAAEVSQEVKTNAKNIALGSAATASSGGTGAGNAIDGKTGTRWESAAEDPQWISLDLKKLYKLDSITLNWEGAYGKTYTVQSSSAETPGDSDWTIIFTEPNGNGGIDNIALHGEEARHVRIHGTARGTQWGYSLWELEVYGNPSSPDPVLPLGPALTVDSTDNKAGNGIELAFAGDAAWEGAITAVKVNNASLAASQYTIAAGKITLGPAAFAAAGSYTVTVTATGYADNEVTQVIEADVNLALNKTAVASSVQGAFLAAEATDGDAGSRWGADWTSNTDNHPEWIYVDLGAAESFGRLALNWEGAYGKSFEIQVAQPGADLSDNASWTTVHTVSGQSLSGEGLKQTIRLEAPAQGQYVRIYVTEKGFAPYGPSLYEIEIYK